VNRAMGLGSFVEVSNRVASEDSFEVAHDTVHFLLGQFLPSTSSSMISQRYERLMARQHMVNQGEMGLVELSSYDPIFFLHHCNVDRWYAEWQNLHPNREVTWNELHSSALISRSNGTQQLPPGSRVKPETQLHPFEHTSRSCANIRDLGYQYDGFIAVGRIPRMSLFVNESAALTTSSSLLAVSSSSKNVFRAKVLLHHIDPNVLKGSFSILAVETGSRAVLDQNCVFGRWNKQACENCQTKGDISVSFNFDTTTTSENELKASLEFIVFHFGTNRPLRDVFGEAPVLECRLGSIHSSM